MPDTNPPPPSDDDGIPAELCIPASTRDDVQALVADILRLERRTPVVVLTSAPGAAGSALDPRAIRGIVGASVPVWFVPAGELTEDLGDQLPHRFGVPEGARIYWPGITTDSDPRDHPLLRDRSGGYGQHMLRRFRELWQAGPPLDRDQIPTMIRDYIQRLRREWAQALESNGRMARRVDIAEQSAEQANERARAAERRLRAAEETATSGRNPELDPEDAFHLLLFEKWLVAFPGPDDRRSRPLVHVTFGRDFIADVEAQTLVSPQRIARVCAMVATRTAASLHGLRVHALRSGAAGNDPQVVRDDGAKAFRCSIQHNTPGAPCLHWWELPDGTIEFANVRHHDSFDITK